MADTFSPKKRSEIMSKIKGKDTKPELIVRSFLHRRGFRFSLQSNKLPGKPDIVLRKYKTVVFIHGCFWHQCQSCRAGRLPRSNIEYWEEKLKKNKARDELNTSMLIQMEWKVCIVWECETKNKECLEKALREILPLKG